MYTHYCVHVLSFDTQIFISYAINTRSNLSTEWCINLLFTVILNDTFTSSKWHWNPFVCVMLSGCTMNNIIYVLDVGTMHRCPALNSNKASVGNNFDFVLWTKLTAMFVADNPGLYLLSGRMFYRKISRSLEAARLRFKLFQFTSIEWVCK